MSALGQASRVPVIILAAVIASALVAAFALSCLGGAPHITSSPTTGTIVGKVLLFSEPAVVNSSACKAPPEMYSSRQLVLTSSTGTVVSLPLNQDGAFVGQLPAGSYQVAISNCNFLGCNLPMPAQFPWQQTRHHLTLSVSTVCLRLEPLGIMPTPRPNSR